MRVLGEICLLLSLVANQLLEKRGSRYANTRLSRILLTTTSPKNVIAASRVETFSVRPIATTKTDPTSSPAACTSIRPPARRRASRSASNPPIGTLTALAK